MRKFTLVLAVLFLMGSIVPAVLAEGAVAPAKRGKLVVKKVSNETWVCPMGDYSGPKTKDGKCPKCGMDLVKKKVAPAKKVKPAAPATKSQASDEKKVVWTCSMCGGSFDKPGHCPECGMDLVKKN